MGPAAESLLKERNLLSTREGSIGIGSHSSGLARPRGISWEGCFSLIFEIFFSVESTRASKIIKAQRTERRLSEHFCFYWFLHGRIYLLGGICRKKHVHSTLFICCTYSVSKVHLGIWCHVFKRLFMKSSLDLQDIILVGGVLKQTFASMKRFV